MNDNSVKKRILFLCTGNSCRSQMAEGWCRHLYSERAEVFSAGLEAQGVNPFAQQVMSEAGVDISNQRSTEVKEYLDQAFDLVVTVCDHAEQNCPVLTNVDTRVHSPFPDPPKMAKSYTEPESQLDCYRQVRDQIRDWVSNLEVA